MPADIATHSPVSAAPVRRNGRGWREWTPTLTLGAILAYLVVAPLAALIISSLRPTGFPLDDGWTLGNYVKAYGNVEFLSLLSNTVVFAVGATVVAVSTALLLAWVLERTDVPGRAAFRVMVLIPIAIPPLLLALGWALLGNPRNGLINQILRPFLDGPLLNPYTMTGMILLQGLSLVPTAFLIVAPTLRNLDPSMEEAARTCGAGFLKTVTRTVLPMIAPALATAGIIILIACFVLFDIPGALGMPSRIYVLSTRVFYLMNNSPTGAPLYGEVSALAMLFLAMLLAMGWAYRRMTSQSRRFVTVTGKAFRPRMYSLGRWKWAVTALLGLYVLVALLLPLGVLAWMSFLPYPTAPTLDSFSLLTVENHAGLFESDIFVGSVANSLIVAVVAATLVTILGGLVSWMVVRSRLPGRVFIDNLAFIPLAIPGVMIGVALIYVYLALGSAVPIYGTIWIIVAGYLTQYLPYGARLAGNVMLQLHNELEEAGRTSGGSPAKVMLRITLPIVLPALLGVWVWVASHYLRELSTALMLQGNDNSVVTTLLWDAWAGGDVTRSAAIGIWLIVGTSSLLLLWQVVSRLTARTSKT